jgi:site-specific DNA-methyltransferase (adenine-specific)
MTCKSYTGRANINIYHGDCMEFMKNKPAKSYDLAICDPPYGINNDGQKLSINKNPKHNRKEHTQKNWDLSIPNETYFNYIYSISDNQILWGANYYPQYLNSSKAWIVWYKGQNNLTMSDVELAYSSFDKVTRQITINRGVLNCQNTFHPTEKPYKLYKWLLTNYAKPNDKILDTHGGSMSIAIACWDLGFDLDIIELDKDYYDKAVQRFERHINQKQIF